MSGIEPLQNVADSQVACFGGGPLLGAEGIDVTRPNDPEPPKGEAERTAWSKSDKKPEKKTSLEKSTRKLLSALLSTNLAQPILVSIAQARRALIFSAGDLASQTKQLSVNFDEVSIGGGDVTSIDLQSKLTL